MSNSKSTLSNYLKFFGILIGIAAAMFLVIKLGIFFIPLVIGFAVSQIIEPLIRTITKKTPLSRGLTGAILALVFYAVIGTLLFFAISKLLSEAYGLVSWVISAAPNLQSDILAATSMFQDFFESVDPNIQNAISSVLQSIVSALQSLLSSLGSWAVGFATSLPTYLFYTMITLLSTVLFSSEHDKAVSFYNSQIPKDWVQILKYMKADLATAVGGYFKAQLKIVCVVGTIVLIAFNIIDLNYAFLLSILVAIFDVLPVFGAGTFMIPATIYGFATGDIKLGISMLIIYAIVNVTRQIIEPRIVGSEIGLNPLISLFAVFTGFKLFGAIGLLFGPIFILTYRNMIGLYLGGRTISDVIQGVPRKPIMDEDFVPGKSQ